MELYDQATKIISEIKKGYFWLRPNVADQAALFDYITVNTPADLKIFSTTVFDKEALKDILPCQRLQLALALLDDTIFSNTGQKLASSEWSVFSSCYDVVIKITTAPFGPSCPGLADMFSLADFSWSKFTAGSFETEMLAILDRYASRQDIDYHNLCTQPDYNTSFVRPYCEALSVIGKWRARISATSRDAFLNKLQHEVSEKGKYLLLQNSDIDQYLDQFLFESVLSHHVSLESWITAVDPQYSCLSRFLGIVLKRDFHKKYATIFAREQHSLVWATMQTLLGSQDLVADATLIVAAWEEMFPEAFSEITCRSKLVDMAKEMERRLREENRSDQDKAVYTYLIGYIVNKLQLDMTEFSSLSTDPSTLLGNSVPLDQVYADNQFVMQQTFYDDEDIAFYNNTKNEFVRWGWVVDDTYRNAHFSGSENTIVLSKRFNGVEGHVVLERRSALSEISVMARPVIDFYVHRGHKYHWDHSIPDNTDLSGKLFANLSCGGFGEMMTDHDKFDQIKNCFLFVDYNIGFSKDNIPYTVALAELFLRKQPNWADYHILGPSGFRAPDFPSLQLFRFAQNASLLTQTAVQ